MIEMIVWIQCTPGGPFFASASPSKLESRCLLYTQLYSGEDMSWADIKAEGWEEKRFKVTEIPEGEEIGNRRQ